MMAAQVRRCAGAQEGIPVPWCRSASEGGILVPEGERSREADVVSGFSLGHGPRFNRD